ncbi:hypothetical protein [Streptomyces sp. NPDC008092]|uniref:hypothetical protein n=1 Tax=Streptomyces sp. NPDC008092 TaxID=3364808 RepID=UPI0036EA41E9
MPRSARFAVLLVPLTAHAAVPGAADARAKQEKRLKSWGSNRSGQLGNGTTTDSSTPVTTLTALTGVDKIAAPVGGDFSLAN